MRWLAFAARGRWPVGLYLRRPAALAALAKAGRGFGFAVDLDSGESWRADRRGWHKLREPGLPGFAAGPAGATWLLWNQWADAPRATYADFEACKLAAAAWPEATWVAFDAETLAVWRRKPRAGGWVHPWEELHAARRRPAEARQLALGTV